MIFCKKLLKFMKKHILFFLCYFFLCSQSVAQKRPIDTTLFGYYQNMFQYMATDEQFSCEESYAMFGKYFYSQSVGGKTYKEWIDKIQAKGNNVTGLNAFPDLDKYPLMVLATYLYYESISAKYDSVRADTVQAEHWINIKKVKGIMRGISQKKYKIKDIESQNLLEDIRKSARAKKIRCSSCIERCKEMIFDRIGSMVNASDANISQYIDDFIKEVDKRMMNLDTLGKILGSKEKELSEKFNELNKLRLVQNITDIKGSIKNDTLFAPILRNVRAGWTEDINVSEFALGAYCDEKIKNKGKDYAKSRAYMLNEVLLTSNRLVIYYDTLRKKLQQYAKKFEEKDMPILTDPNAFAKDKLNVNIIVTGKADGSASCFQRNWNYCIQFGSYGSEFNPVSQPVKCSNDGGVTFYNKIIKSENGVNSDEVHFLTLGSRLNNVLLAFLRAYCFGREIYSTFMAQRQERYNLTMSYKAIQYTVSSDKSRGFEILVDLTHTNEFIGEYEKKIDKDIKKINEKTQKMDKELNKLKEMREKLKEN